MLYFNPSHPMKVLDIVIQIVSYYYTIYTIRIADYISDNTLLPLCTQHILDKRFYKYSYNSPNVAMKPVQQPPCRLIEYQQAETVQCFDILLNNNMMNKSADNINGGSMVLTFIGDSRIRQLFAERMKVYF